MSISGIPIQNIEEVNTPPGSPRQTTCWTSITNAISKIPCCGKREDPDSGVWSATTGYKPPHMCWAPVRPTKKEQ